MRLTPSLFPVSHADNSVSHADNSVSHADNSVSHVDSSVSHADHFISRPITHTAACHPPVTLVTLKSRVQPLYTKGFCHPDTLKAKNPCMDSLCACRLHGTLCLTLRLCARVKTKQDSALKKACFLYRANFPALFFSGSKTFRIFATAMPAAAGHTTFHFCSFAARTGTSEKRNGKNRTVVSTACLIIINQEACAKCSGFP